MVSGYLYGGSPTCLLWYFVSLFSKLSCLARSLPVSLLVCCLVYNLLSVCILGCITCRQANRSTRIQIDIDSLSSCLPASLTGSLVGWLLECLCMAPTCLPSGYLAKLALALSAACHGLHGQRAAMDSMDTCSYSHALNLSFV